jgi:uncharacterized protein YecT (DUF1311 family)
MISKMKKVFALLSFLFVSYTSFAQNDGPKEITPQVLQKIKATIERQIPAFKQRISNNELSPDQIEFSVDTFRIEQLASKRMEIDYSTYSMIEATVELTASYDKLLNKYYNKLLKALKPEDQKILISAQRAWLVYREGEIKLINTMVKDEYSGGGTIQSLRAVGSYGSLVVNRTKEIFEYYDSIVKE